jgi:hypothetical protein
LYAQDNYSGSWRFANGFNSDSQAWWSYSEIFIF